MKKKNENLATEKTKSEKTVEELLSDVGGTESTQTSESEPEPKPEEKIEVEKEMTEEEKELLKNLGLYKDAPENPHPVKKKKYSRRTGTQDKKTETGMPVSGKFLIKLTDRGMNSMLVAADKYLYKEKSRIKVSDLALKNDEIDDDMISLANEALKAMKLSADPITAFFGGMALLSLTKYIIVKGES